MKNSNEITLNMKKVFTYYEKLENEKNEKDCKLNYYLSLVYFYILNDHKSYIYNINKVK